jgi:hypothetical protein
LDWNVLQIDQAFLRGDHQTPHWPRPMIAHIQLQRKIFPFDTSPTRPSQLAADAADGDCRPQDSQDNQPQQGACGEESGWFAKASQQQRDQGEDDE